jgi:uncharacterized protein
VNVLVLGATGFIGRMLVLRLAREGHVPLAWVRDVEAARSQLGADVELLDAGTGDEGLVAALQRCEAVVNLAGASIARRWTARVRAESHSSRVGLTERLVAAMGRATPRPRVLVNGSAVGYYGGRGDEWIDESSSAGTDTLGKLCVAWEAAAFAAREHGLRVVCMRTGLVLGTDGGPLAPMLATTRLGLGATFGSGRQFMPWIHRNDLVEMIACAVEDERWSGAVNGVAPAPVPNREFADTLARAARRPRLLNVPAFALRIALGEAADIVLAGQRVRPQRALDLGFEFRFADLAPALADLVDGPTSIEITRPHEWPDVEPLRSRPPTHRLETSITVACSRAELWSFFERPRNLAGITPGDAGFRFVGDVPETMHSGDTIDADVAVGPTKLRWSTRIDMVEPEQRFRDSQVRGPFGVWVHEHELRAEGDRTVLVDRLWYSPPLGVLGRIAHAMGIAPRLRATFAHRAQCLALRFGR